MINKKLKLDFLVQLFKITRSAETFPGKSGHRLENFPISDKILINRTNTNDSELDARNKKYLI